MSERRRQEILQAYDSLVALRDRVERSEASWDGLGDFFTEDAVFIDPAWGRVEGLDAIRRFLVESMTGLEGWTFPRQWTLVEGDRLVSGWMNRLPGQRADGSFYECLGISVMTWAGGGRFSREEDLLNMAHVVELIRESGWRPGPGFNPPPAEPPR
jgi:ketosteroid isomerase-like protein